MLFKNGRYANVASTLALVVALGGTSYAAVAIPKNSVGSPQIINSSVKSVDVKNGALKAADFKAGELPAGTQCPAGPAGPAGSAGATGPAGPAGATGSAGTARAFGRVSGGATPVLGTQQGFTAVIHNEVGLYCLALPGFDASTSSWFATVDWRSTCPRRATHRRWSSATNAPPPTRWGSTPSGSIRRPASRRRPTTAPSTSWCRDPAPGTNPSVLSDA